MRRQSEAPGEKKKKAQSSHQQKGLVVVQVTGLDADL
jgi:hypothetical protein